MKQLVLTCLTLSLLSLSAVSFAGRGGTISIVNSTGYPIHKVSTSGASSMNHWNLPEKINPQSVQTQYVEFKYQRKWYFLWTPTIWTNRGHAETTYTAYCPNGKSDTIKVISNVVDNNLFLPIKILNSKRMIPTST